ncbi:hypothetical protein [uncultured Aquimarina sp.]|uniref:hypothetical protein n=1 Tax=uncultured Aquimarina sp. TaxID=575652 RepID=UPI002625656B|nr:hypothetical protein [uncultured Aquimarina sp.]
MIDLFTTGGTIEDLKYASESEKLTETSIGIAHFLEILNPQKEIIVEKVMSKDSRFITDDDRLKLLSSIENV